jgi:hypothetical protein
MLSQAEKEEIAALTDASMMIIRALWVRLRH